MTNNKNILQAYLKFYMYCKHKNRPSKWPALVKPFNEENYSHHSKCKFIVVFLVLPNMLNVEEGLNSVIRYY